MKKKSRTGLIIGIAAVVVLVVGVAVFMAGTMFRRSPELRLKMGAANLLQEMAQYKNPFFEKIDFDAINELKKTTPIHTNTDVSITVPESEVSNLSFCVDALTDIGEKKAQFDISAGVYGFDVSIAELTASADTLYLKFPVLLKDTYSLGLTSLGEEFNNSEWASLWEIELPEDYSIELFRTEREADSSEGLLDIIRKSGGVIKKNTVYERLEEKRDGCSGVRLTVSRDAVNNYMESLRNDIFESDFYADYVETLTDGAGIVVSESRCAEMKDTLDMIIEEITAVRLDADYVLDFYFDKKGRIVNISTPADIALQGGGAVAIDIDLLGEERTMDIIDGGIYAKNGERISYIGIKRDAEVSDVLYNEKLELTLQTDSHNDDMTFSYVNAIDKEDMCFDMELEARIPDNTVRVEADGEFTDIVQGESCTFRLNNSSLAVDGETLGYAAAVIVLEPSDEKLTLPEDTVDLLKMDAYAIQKMVYEAIGSIRKFNYE